MADDTIAAAFQRCAIDGRQPYGGPRCTKFKQLTAASESDASFSFHPVSSPGWMCFDFPDRQSCYLRDMLGLQPLCRLRSTKVASYMQ